MNFHLETLVVLAGLVGLQALPAQGQLGTSMCVKTSDGPRGYVCEPFQCTPHDAPVNPGERFLVEIYGAPGWPYILFAGAPADPCYGLPWAYGELAMDLPVLILDVGLVPTTGNLSKCGLETAATKVEIPGTAPAGAKLALQASAWPQELDMPAFTRAAKLIVKAIH